LAARKMGVDRFHLPVAIALGLLVIESLVGTRRTLPHSTSKSGAAEVQLKV
jgi:hypothetical protein